jgi:hypothetical protein
MTSPPRPPKQFGPSPYRKRLFDRKSILDNPGQIKFGFQCHARLFVTMGNSYTRPHDGRAKCPIPGEVRKKISAVGKFLRMIEARMSLINHGYFAIQSRDGFANGKNFEIRAICLALIRLHL